MFNPQDVATSLLRKPTPAEPWGSNGSTATRIARIPESRATRSRGAGGGGGRDTGADEERAGRGWLRSFRDAAAAWRWRGARCGRDAAGRSSCTRTGPFSGRAGSRRPAARARAQTGRRPVDLAARGVWRSATRRAPSATLLDSTSFPRCAQAQSAWPPVPLAPELCRTGRQARPRGWRGRRESREPPRERGLAAGRETLRRRPRCPILGGGGQTGCMLRQVRRGRGRDGRGHARRAAAFRSDPRPPSPRPRAGGEPVVVLVVLGGVLDASVVAVACEHPRLDLRAVAGLAGRPGLRAVASLAGRPGLQAVGALAGRLGLGAAAGLPVRIRLLPATLPQRSGVEGQRARGLRRGQCDGCSGRDGLGIVPSAEEGPADPCGAPLAPRASLPFPPRGRSGIARRSSRALARRRWCFCLLSIVALVLASVALVLAPAPARASRRREVRGARRDVGARGWRGFRGLVRGGPRWTGIFLCGRRGRLQDHGPGRRAEARASNCGGETGFGGSTVSRGAQVAP